MTKQLISDSALRFNSTPFVYSYEVISTRKAVSARILSMMLSLGGSVGRGEKRDMMGVSL